MIEIKNLKKSFDDINAVDDISLNIKEGQVFGMIGTNGAGKSTVMRLISGVLKPDSGSVKVDNEESYDNVKAKEKLFFISDDFYFFNNASASDMIKYEKRLRPQFDADRCYRLIKDFGLDRDRSIKTFSKGMKRQAAIILGICANTKYLLCDETFDGLDPVMRQSVKSLFANDMEQRGLVPVISSHNLRELEDICDEVGLLHKGGVLLTESLDNAKLGIQKVQCVFKDEKYADVALQGLDVLIHDQQGRLHTLTVTGSRDEIETYFRQFDMAYFEILALTLEELFISETEAAGYNIRKIILGDEKE